MKVLHVEAGMNLYGGALQVHYLLRGIAERKDVKCTLVCPEGSAISAAARGYVPSLHVIPMRGDLDLFILPRLRWILRREDPDIIHLHSRRGADILGGLAARLTGTPCILTRRVDNPENRQWARLKYRLFDRVITISEGIREVLISEGVPAEKITRVHSAVDQWQYNQPCDTSWFREEFGLDADSVVCGVVAQLIDRKGHRYLLRAVPEILHAVPSAVFLIFGKGPLEDQLRTACRDMGIEGRVRFTGFREDLDRILGCLDLVIHPASMEGLGVSLLQAAAAGVPIVGTRVGGIPEIVQDGINGYLVPPRNVHSIVDAVTHILTDKNLARRMGEEGRRITRELFSVEAMVEGNLKVYREIMKGKSEV